MIETRFFQWLDGESEGAVVTLTSVEEDGGRVFLYFSDGEYCDREFVCPITNNESDLRGKALVEITSPSNTWKKESTQNDRCYYNKETNERVEAPSYEDYTGHALKSVRYIVPSNQSNIGKPLPMPEKIKKKKVKENVVTQPTEVTETTQTIVPIETTESVVKETSPTVPPLRIN